MRDTKTSDYNTTIRPLNIHKQLEEDNVRHKSQESPSVQENKRKYRESDQLEEANIGEEL